MRKIFSLLSLTVLLAVSTTVAQATPLLSVAPSAKKINTGGTLFVDVIISGLVDDPITKPGDEDALGAFDLRLVYNPSVLDFITLAFGNQLDVLGLGSINGFAEDPNPAVGAVDFFEVSLDLSTELETLQADSFLMARVAFRGLDEGWSTLNLAVPVLSDAYGNRISASVKSAQVKVSEPKTTILLFMGLAVLISKARRPRKRLV